MSAIHALCNFFHPRFHYIEEWKNPIAGLNHGRIEDWRYRFIRDEEGNLVTYNDCETIAMVGRDVYRRGAVKELIQGTTDFKWTAIDFPYREDWQIVTCHIRVLDGFVGHAMFYSPGEKLCADINHRYPIEPTALNYSFHAAKICDVNDMHTWRRLKHWDDLR